MVVFFIYRNHKNINIPSQVLCTQVGGGLAVAERALKIWTYVEQFINSYKNLPKSKVPTLALYIVIRKAVGDPLFEAKLQFIACVARQLKPFLEAFQTAAPIMPFLAKDLQALASLLSCFMKRKVPETPV